MLKHISVSKCSLDLGFRLFVQEILKESKLEIINKDDLPVNQMLKNLGLFNYKSFLGLSDREEIINRNQIFSFLRKHPESQAFVQFLQSKPGLPYDQQEFLDYFHKDREHNPYWEAVHSFVNFFEKYTDLPARLLTLLTALKEHLYLELSENEMGVMMSETIEKAAVIDGIIDFSCGLELEKADKGEDEDYRGNRYALRMINWSVLDAQISGYKAFSFDVSEFVTDDYPGWSYKWWAKLLGLKRWQRKKTDRLNKKRLNRAYDSMRIHRMSEKEFDDLREALSERLSRMRIHRNSNLCKFFFSGATREFEGKLFFSFNSSGLKIKVIDLQISKDENEALTKWDMSSHLSFDLSIEDLTKTIDFSGFSDSEIRELKASRDVLLSKTYNKQKEVNSALIRQFIFKSCEDFFDMFEANSDHLDATYRWFFLKTLYASQAVKDVYEEIQLHRKFFNNALNDMKLYVEINGKIDKYASKFGSDVTMPDIMGSKQHVVEFNNLCPVYLLAKETVPEIKPVMINNIPQINGSIIFLTGFHGGGKTTTGQSLQLTAYLALSGLPVLASLFKINVKKALGSVISSEGDHSTATVLIQKYKALLEGMKKVDSNEILLFIDEIGKGTQENSGIELGLDIMQTLTENHVSAVINSQILQLANIAQKEFGAVCLKVDDKHRFSPGVADGGMKKLRKRTGIDHYLSKSHVTINLD